MSLLELELRWDRYEMEDLIIIAKSVHCNWRNNR